MKNPAQLHRNGGIQMTEQDKVKIAEKLQKSMWKEKRKMQAELGKRTMSIMEMGALLGLKKTESYWLAKKHFFKLVYLRGRARVDIESFEKWYANQVTYHKVDGEPPGEDLRQSSLSAFGRTWPAIPLAIVLG